MTARIASAKAMSVAVGIAHPRSDRRRRPRRPRRRRPAAGTTIPPDGGDDRQRGPPRVAQVAGDELALELQTGDEEEDGEQPVGGPGAEAQVEVQRATARRRGRAGRRTPRTAGLFAQTSATTAAAMSSSPPVVSARRISPTRAASGKVPRENSRWRAAVGCCTVAPGVGDVMPTRLPGAPAASLAALAQGSRRGRNRPAHAALTAYGLERGLGSGGGLSPRSPHPWPRGVHAPRRGRRSGSTPAPVPRPGSRRTVCRLAPPPASGCGSA